MNKELEIILEKQIIQEIRELKADLFTLWNKDLTQSHAKMYQNAVLALMHLRNYLETGRLP